MGWTVGALVVLLLALPSPIGAMPTSGAHASAHGSVRTVPSTGLLPAGWSAPWAQRVGYDSTMNGHVQHLVATSGPVTVSITLRPRDASYFAAPTPGSNPLSLAQIADKFGVSSGQYLALEQYFTGEGLTVLHEWPNRMSLTVTGPAYDVGRAFGTSLYSGVWQGRSVRIASSVPTLPSAFAPEVAAVSGLSDGFTSFSLPFAPAGPVPGPLAGRTTRFITPVELHVAYNLDGLYNSSGTSHWASGVGIALLLWGEGYAPSDLQSFYGSYYPSEFPGVRFAPYPIDGAPLPSSSAAADPSGATQELTLDMEWSGSEAPGATLDAVYAPDGPASNGYSPSDAAMEDAVNKAVQQISGVQVVSMSFGTQDGSDVSFQVAFSSAFATAAQQGITVLAASGDNSGLAHANCSGNVDPQFPASSPQVVAVGGTALTLALDPFGAVTGIDSEPAWNGSGGGYSNQYSAPSWQEVGSAAGPVRAAAARGIPDVAGPSADNFFFFNGATAAGKGTSFATPMWAGMIAEMDAVRGHPFGFLPPRLYTIGAGEENHTTALGLVDITSGSTCLGPATTGWDTATGWGSPRAFLLYEDLVSTYVTEALSTSSPNVAPGGSFTATVHVANLTNAAPLASVLVQFALSSDGQVGLCSGVLESQSATTDPRGDASVGLAVPSCYFGSKVVLTATIASRGYFATNTTTLDVNLLGLAGFLAVIQVFPYNVVAFGLIIIAAVLLAWQLGEWRHRRQQTRDGRSGMRRGPGPGSSGTPPPPPPPSEPSPTSAGVTPSAAGLGSGNAIPPEAGGLGSPPVSGVPAHVLDPPVPRAPGPSSQGLPHCSSCGRAVGFVATVCPGCGASLA
ncbi:MAG: S53 family peptidase [Thermoplasmata archaeon]|nr:S53 family peptidase [Thermoplasmata archaeon]